MTTKKNKPVVPIPRDIAVGTKIKLRNGKIVEVEAIGHYGPNLIGLTPGILHWDGTPFEGHGDNGDEAVAILANASSCIRKSPKPTPQPEKAARPDKDAVWLLRHAMADSDMAMHFDSYDKRIRAIARRLNGGNLPVTRKGKSK